MEKETFLVAREAFTNPIEWRAAKELLRRGSYVIEDRVRHFNWEWLAISEK